MPHAGQSKSSRPTREKALVKCVKQGDLLTILLANSGNEKLVNIYGIKTPSIAQQIVGRNTHDDPYAWHARELIRQLVIGRVVDVEFLSPIDKGNPRSGWTERAVANVFFEGQNLAVLLLEKGFAVIDAKCRNDPTLQDAIEAEDKARTAKLGVFSENLDPKAIRSIKWEKGGIEFIPGWVQLNRGKTLDAIVETVENGNSVVCYFCDSQLVTRVLLSGIRCDSPDQEIKLDAKTTDINLEALAKESKNFVEIRLLCRQVPIKIDGCDPYGNVYGSLLHPKGNIAEILLEEGLAELNDKSSDLVDEDYLNKLRNAQKRAQDAGKKRWKGSLQPKKKEAVQAERIISDKIVAQKQFTGRIVEIISGDALVIVPTDEQDKMVTPSDYLSKARRVYLSSIRAPRGKTKEREAEPWYTEAIDILRSHIGKLCDFKLDYFREQTNIEQLAVASDDAGRLHFVTIFPQNSKLSINRQLVQSGLARVIKHRVTEDRSQEYDELTAAEKAAIEMKLGLLGEKAPPRRLVNDLSGRENQSKAKAMETSLKREKVLEGIVEHVVNGGRYKIFIPTQSVMISFVLSGVSAPQTGRLLPGGEISEGEPFAAESHAWAVLNVLYRKVSVQILSLDRGGSFVGILYRPDKKAVQTVLVRAGYARPNHRSGFSCPILDELIQAEEDAAKAQRGMWVLPEMIEEYHQSETKLGSPSTRDETDALVRPLESFKDVKLAHFNNAASFYIGANSSKDQNCHVSMRVHKFGLEFEKQTPGAPLPYNDSHRPRRNDLVIVLSSQSGTWERAKLTSAPRDVTASADVFLIDWGSYDRIPVDHMFPCPAELNLVEYPPLVTHVKLALVKKPSVFKSTDKLRAIMQQETRDKSFDADVVGSVDPLTGALPVLLYRLGDSGLGEPYQIQLVRDGQLLIDQRELKRIMRTNPNTVSKSILESLQAAENDAKSNRLEIWYYGDCTSDQDED